MRNPETWLVSLPVRVHLLPKGLALLGTGLGSIALTGFILLYSDSISISLAAIMLAGICAWQIVLISRSYHVEDDHDLLNITLETVVDMYWRWDLERQTFNYQGTLPDLLGYPLSANPDAAFWSTVIHPVDRPLQKYQLLRHLENESKPYYCEYRMRDHSGNYHWFVGRGKVVKRDHSGKATLMVGSLEHIQDRKELEQKLIQAHKMEAVGQLTGGIAHDFNNALGSILGYTELALETSREPKHRDYMQQILQSGYRAKHLVNQLLDFSRKTSVNPQPTDLEQEARQAVDMIRGTLPEAISVLESYPPEPCFGYLDADQLQRVLLNLCINGKDAIKNRGRLAVSLVTEKVDQQQCNSCQGKFSGKYHCLTITDDGTGISQSIAHQLFDPFFTTKNFGKGTGMGLAVVHGIVHEFNGHINLISAPGLGTQAKIYIPICRS